MFLDIPKPGDSFTERQLYERFNIRNSGGIRPSNKNKVIVLISSFFTTNSGQGNYQDKIDEEDGIVYYVGEGDGDQQMIRNNRGILESKNRGFRLLYFRKPEQNHVVFKFEVEYDSHVYLTQRNSEGRSRKVIQFKLRII